MSASPDSGIFDVIIVGGGPAGLSAALLLGRCRRRTLVFDAGDARNADARRAWGVFTRDGEPAANLRRLGREQLERYDVPVLDERVEDARSTPDGFEVIGESGRRWRSRKLVLATGVADRRPEVRGLEEFHGTSVWPCPYCDGWEVRERRLAAWSHGADAVEFALALSTWSREVVLLTDGDESPGEDARARLRRNGIEWIATPVERLEGREGRLERIVFRDGSAIERDAMFYHLGFVQKSTLPERLGCGFDARGFVETAYGPEQTCVSGLYVIGDASHDAMLISVAAAEGVKAAVDINKRLRADDER